MEWAGSVGLEGLEVVGGGVAFVLIPVVLRKFVVEVFHEFVSVGFGEDGGGRNALVFAVSLGYAVVGEGAIGQKFCPVDEEGFGLGGEFFEAPVHGEQGRLEDVVCVDFFDGCAGNGVGEGLFFADFGQAGPFFGGEFFGVVESGDGVFENDGSSYHGPG